MAAAAPPAPMHLLLLLLATALSALRAAAADGAVAATAAVGAATADGGACAVGADGEGCEATGDETSALQLKAMRDYFDPDPELAPLVAGAGDSIEQLAGGWLGDQLLKNLSKMVLPPHMFKDGLSDAPQASGCDMMTESGCPISNPSFIPKVPVNVITDPSKTACLSGSPYQFNVIKGDLDKVHLHLQGGGACWSNFSYNVPLCTTEAVFGEPAEGIWNVSNTENPFKDYTIVTVLYCSGDAHMGISSQNWGPPGTVRKMWGYKNTRVVVDWVQANFPSLDSFVVSGSSAGSLGVQGWARTLAQEFSTVAKDIVFFDDSFVGVLYPPSIITKSETFLFDVWGTCHTPLVTAAEAFKCSKSRLVLSDLWVAAMRSFRGRRFSSINSKADATQIMFERAFELTAEYNLRGALMSPGQYYKSASLMMADWQKQPNYYSYMVNGTMHTYFPQKYFYTATPNGYNATSGQPTLIDWVAELTDPAASGNAAKAVCLGTPKNLSKSTRVGPQEVSYCDTKLRSRR